VLLYPEGMVKLNQSAGEILKRLDGRRTLADVTADCETAFDAAGLLDDVLGFIGAALEQGWVRRV
jgi:pyrroloquinoline quinone biosynthesis protein D